MSEDLRELLASLTSSEARFLVIGAHAVGHYTRPRLTEDVDLWLGRDRSNVDRLANVLDRFGAPIGQAGASAFAEKERQMIRLGRPPNMVDLLNFAGDSPFDEVWERRVSGLLEGLPVFFPSLEDLLAMKRVAGRPQDLADLDRLERARRLL